jgi:hypothetical protein
LAHGTNPGAGSTAPPPRPGIRGGLARLFGGQRLLTVVIVVGLVWLPLQGIWKNDPLGLLHRLGLVGLVAMLIFGLLERWPRRLPRLVSRWVVQVVAVAVSIPMTILVIYIVSTPADGPPLWQSRERLGSMVGLSLLGVLIGPWVALGALVQQREAFAREQALTFALERSELERRAVDARLHLMQAQVQPHFLFNTLANVRALVELGSPNAPAVLDSLIAYLRAAVPRLDRVAATLDDEMALVTAYLDLMRMRIPDRLRTHINVATDCRALPCLPMSVLTLVENAVRHGIDPAEEGGEIHVTARRIDGRMEIRVEDSGLGLRPGSGGTGTGLSTLRRRLDLAHGPMAGLDLVQRPSGGVAATLTLPAPRGPA